MPKIKSKIQSSKSKVPHFAAPSPKRLWRVGDKATRGKPKSKVEEAVMEKIKTGEIAMKPRWFFVAGSILALAGLAASFVVSVFLTALLRFSLRTHGPMGEYRWNELLASFPWWAVALAVLGIIGGIVLLRRYDFSYKKNFWLVIIGFAAAVVITGWTIDYLGLNDIWFRQGPMRGIMRQYLQKGGESEPDSFKRPGRGWRNR